MPTPRPDVAAAIVARLAEICLALPEARQEQAWTGTRWVIGKQTFAHVVQLTDGWPPVYCRNAGTDGPATVLTFQSAGDELEALGHVGHPFFVPTWRPGIVGMFIDEATDWEEVTELVTDSFLLLAPARFTRML